MADEFMIPNTHFSPEEYEAASGQEAPERVKIWRQTFGPGKSPSGARFRNEISVCTRCHHVTVTRLLPPGECFGTTGRKVRRMDAMSLEAFQRWGHRMSDRQLKALVNEPCAGIRMSPTAEIGYRWLEGTNVETI